LSSGKIVHVEGTGEFDDPEERLGAQE
jgi:hypothetical protein